MDRVENIIGTSDLTLLKDYIDNTEILIEMLENRKIDTTKEKQELNLLVNRYLQVKEIKTNELKKKL